MTSNDQPLVSIVIPVYNQKLTYFRDALESALVQTYANIEIVVSDNHSTNEIPHYLSGITDRRLHIRKPDAFVPMAQNFQFGADQAVGDYLVFLCSDDYLCPDFVGDMVTHLLNYPTISFGYAELACVEHYNLDKVRFYYHRKETGFRPANESLRELLAVRPLLGFFPSLIMRRSAYNSLRHLLSGEVIFAFDIAIVFSLHELGDVFYLNRTLGKVRYWTALDGKTSDDRFLEFVGDTSYVCGLVENMTVVSKNDVAVANWRKFQARRWLLVALFWSVRGNISAEKSTRGIRKIKDEIYPHPLMAGLITWTLKKPQTYLLRPLLKGGFQMLWSLQTLFKRPM